MKEQEAQFEKLTRALEEERRHVSAQLERVRVSPQDANPLMANGTLTRRHQVTPLSIRPAGRILAWSERLSSYVGNYFSPVVMGCPVPMLHGEPIQGCSIVMLRHRGYCCSPGLSGFISRSICLTSCFAGVGFLGWDIILVMVYRIVCSCSQVTSVSSDFSTNLVSKLQESECLLSGWRSWGSCILGSSSVSLRERSAKKVWQCP